MKFYDALKATQETGIGIFRPSWNGNANRAADGVAQFVAPADGVHRHPNSDLTFTPFLFISQPNGITPWVPSQGDLFADDWDTLA